MVVELLAPAGSWEAMQGAVGSGADAVYLGGAFFGARAYAKNFSEEELCRAIDYVHLHNRKLYLTVNTLLKNRELEEQLDAYLLPLYQQGLDGVIVQDLGVFAYIRERFPCLPLHVSTQMTITGVNSAKMMEKEGAARIVAARELSLEELGQIRRETSLEIEAFVHGALCYCYSGQCLFSSILGGRSGNRGRCAQPCRLPYQVGERKAHLLSPKDICTLELLPDILQAGVNSLKIEGRMKQPEYVAGVVSVYRKYLDLCLEGRPAAAWDKKQLRQDLEFLRNLFQRGGFCQGYYRQKPGPSMIAFQNEKKIGACRADIRKRKEKIKGYLMLSSESRAILEISSKSLNGCKVVVKGEVPAQARKHPADRKRIVEQMCKTGDTPFVFEDFKLQMKEELFLPASQLNSLRRKGIQALEQKILQAYQRQKPPKEATAMEFTRNKDLSGGEVSLSASCETQGQWQILNAMDGIKELFLGIALFEKLCQQEGAAYFRDLAERRDWLLALPYVTRQRDLQRLSKDCEQAIEYGCKGFLVRNLESFGLLAKKGWAKRCHLDAGLYTYNNRAVDFWRNQNVAADMTPLELNQKEIAHRDNSRSYMLVYGYLPLMVSAQCIQKNTGKCNHAGRCLSLKDRYQKEFPVQCCCDFCYNIIYNTLPYGLLEYKEALQRMGLHRFFLSFSLENPAETKKVMEAFQKAYGQGEVTQGFSFTKGHMKRKVE